MCVRNLIEDRYDRHTADALGNRAGPLTIGHAEEGRPLLLAQRRAADSGQNLDYRPGVKVRGRRIGEEDARHGKTAIHTRSTMPGPHFSAAVSDQAANHHVDGRVCNLLGRPPLDPLPFSHDQMRRRHAMHRTPDNLR